MSESASAPPGAPQFAALPPEMAAFYALPSEVPSRAGERFETGEGGVLALARVAAAIARHLEERGGDADGRLLAFQRAWPRIQALERYLAIGNSEFAERVALDLMAEFPELPVARFGAGAARAARGDWDGAAAEFAAAHRLAPGDRRTLSELYLALALGERYDEAKRLEPDLGGTPAGRRLRALFGPRVADRDAAGLARLVAALGGLSRARGSNDADQVLAAARELARAFPGEAAVLVHAADAEREAGDRPSALALADRVTRLDPGHAPGWLLLGTLALEAGDRVEAERAALRARAADPDDPECVALHARVLRADGRPGQAARLLESARARFPDEPRLTALLAGALLEDLDAGRAVALLDEDVKRRPFDPTAWYNLGRAHEAAGRLDDAGAAYRAALEQAPRFPEATEALGLCLDRQGRTAEGRELLERLVAEEPDSPFGWRGLGDLQLSSDIGEAARAYARAIELRPELPMAGTLYLAALEASRAGRAAEARTLFERAVRTDPRRHEAWCGLGAACFDAGEFDRAERAFAEAVRLDGRVAGYRRNLAAAHRAIFRRSPLKYWRSLGRARREEREAERLAGAGGRDGRA
jgi:predicted Zn-dependent protease